VYKNYFVIDTNIILEDANAIFNLSDGGENLVIIPEVVLDEVDSKKSGFSEINYQAREFARVLENMEVFHSFQKENYQFVELIDGKNKNIKVVIISKNSYSLQVKETSKNIINDRKILEIASFSNTYYPKIIFITLDIMARMRAISLNLNTQPMVGSSKDKFDFEFIKNIFISYENPNDLNNQPIKGYNPNHQNQNFCYQFHELNRNQISLGVIQNEKIKIIDEKKLQNQSVEPLNNEQKFFSYSILDSFYDVVLAEAKAGSGKTLLAISGAMKLIKQRLFKKIIYIRNSIESLDKGEDVGYLPGLEEKFAIYNHPLHDSLEFIVKQEYKAKKSRRDGA